ncbi:hypothetical protein ACFOLD_03425 [Kocuria carniphila]|uniref:hypothetical protein n=1 Tax=Kocuria carniphila TaxID=262208 RepID=UPI00360D45DE
MSCIRAPDLFRVQPWLLSPAWLTVKGPPRSGYQIPLRHSPLESGLTRGKSSQDGDVGGWRSRIRCA